MGNILNEFKELNFLGEKADRSKSAKRASRRGKAGEYAIVDLLTEASEQPWARIPGSGARIGKANRERILKYTKEQTESMLGDVYPPHHLQHRFIIEAKNYTTGISLKMLEKGKAPALLKKWIDEVNYDTVTYLMGTDIRRPAPLLYYKLKRMGQWICINDAYYNREFRGINIERSFPVVFHKSAEELMDIGFGGAYSICEAKKFLQQNSEILFL